MKTRKNQPTTSDAVDDAVNDAVGEQPTPPPSQETSSGSRTEQPSGAQQQTMDEVIEGVLRRLASALPPPPPQQPSVAPVPPEFSGLPHEDPRQFLGDIEEYFADARVPAGQWVRVATNHLRGAAGTALQPLARFAVPWAEFREELLERFDGGDVRRRIRADLHCAAQTATEGAESFIWGKRELARRMEPILAEGELVAMIIDLLRPEVRRHVRPYEPTTFPRLLSVARRVEADFDLQLRPKTTARAPVATTSAPTPAARAYYAPTPAARAYTAPTPATRLYAAPTHAAPTRGVATPRQLPECRYCPERHWHRECPVYNAWRQPASVQAPPPSRPGPSVPASQGNSQRAGHGVAVMSGLSSSTTTGSLDSAEEPMCPTSR